MKKRPAAEHTCGSRLSAASGTDESEALFLFRRLALGRLLNRSEVRGDGTRHRRRSFELGFEKRPLKRQDFAVFKRSAAGDLHHSSRNHLGANDGRRIGTLKNLKIGTGKAVKSERITA